MSSLTRALPDRFSFTVDEARERGVPYARLRRSDLIIPSRGVRLVSKEEPSLLNSVAPLTRLGTSDAASHSTSARLWGILIPFRLEEDELLHLTRSSGSNRARRPGVVGHRAPLLPRDVANMYGVSVTSPAWTWTDLAALLSLDELVAAGDSLLRRCDAPARRCELNLPDPLSSVEQIAEVVARRVGSRGIRLAREALPLLRSGVDSAKESILRMMILREGLPEPEVNQWILDERGRRVSRPDLMYREQKIAIEYEGEHHLLDADQWHRDINRDDRLRAMGWIVLRFSRKHLEPDAMRKSIARINVALESVRSSSGQ